MTPSLEQVAGRRKEVSVVKCRDCGADSRKDGTFVQWGASPPECDYCGTLVVKPSKPSK